MTTNLKDRRDGHSTPPDSQEAVGGNQATPARKPLTSAAQRALAEAEARRAEASRKAAEAGQNAPKEFQGPKGPEPTRYGDWESKGIVSDF